MVWAARLKGTRGFQKIVAVKTMLPKLSEDEQFEQMFLDEASLASEIHHPHVVEILDLGEQQGVLFLVMEWIDGVPLNQLMKAARAEGGVPVSVAVRIAMQACAGLHAAHELRNADGKLVGLVHRDVSPQNILVTFEGVTKVVDFGVAKATAIGGGATVAGQIKGKVAYMAPEQIKGLGIDRRVDVFALGIVLYALTTGKHPFRRESEAATMYNICAPQPVMPPSKVIPDYPREVEQIVNKALAKDPDKRYQSANDMLRDLAQLPAALRASTDDEVGGFVRRLLNSKREERQAALASALALADEHAKHRLSTMGYGSEPLRQSVQSSVSVVTGTGAMHLGDGPSGTGVVTAAGQRSARKRLVYISAVAATFLLAVGVVAAISSRDTMSPARPAESAAASVTVAPPPSVSVTSTSSAATPTADVPKTDVTSEPPKPSHGTSPDEASAHSKAKSTGTTAAPAPVPAGRRDSPAPTATATKQTTSAPPKEKTWNKQDPGF